MPPSPVPREAWLRLRPPRSWRAGVIKIQPNRRWRSLTWPRPFPDFSTAPAALIPTLQVVTLSCFSETTGSAFLETCLGCATDPLVRAVFRELLGDDVDHARLGWAHLHSQRLTTENRVALADWIARIAHANLRSWRRRPQFASSPTFTTRGCPSWETIDLAVIGAMRTLIFPGFERAGYQLHAVRTWFEDLLRQ